MGHRVKAYFRKGHGDNPVLVSTDEDMDALIDQLLAEPFSNSIAAIYSLDRPLNAAGVPDHELYLAVNAKAGVGGLRYTGEHTWFSQGTPSSRDEVFYNYMGNDTDFPPDSEISIGLLRQAAKEFLHHNGDRPTCVQWQPDPNTRPGTIAST
jgi:hypothetical protein